MVTVEGSHVVKPRGRLMSGDVVWVRTRGSLWWPAQVVDEKMVSRSSKPQKKFSSEVLVRLYGTYTYLFKDPEKYRSEFEKILEQNNSSYREMFEKALEQDLSRKKPNTLKRRDSEPREAAEAKTPKNKKSKHDTNKTNDQKVNSPGIVTPLKVSSELSVRRVRVMQSLGLVAPLGSPF